MEQLSPQLSLVGTERELERGSAKSVDRAPTLSPPALGWSQTRQVQDCLYNLGQVSQTVLSLSLLTCKMGNETPFSQDHCGKRMLPYSLKVTPQCLVHSSCSLNVSFRPSSWEAHQVAVSELVEQSAPPFNLAGKETQVQKGEAPA